VSEDCVIVEPEVVAVNKMVSIRVYFKSVFEVG